MPRIITVLLLFLFGFIGCQTPPSQSLGNIFSPSSTIPPPETNSYTLNSAPPPGTLSASATPANPEAVSPFTPNRPYAEDVSSQTQADTTLQPFQGATVTTTTETAGSVRVAARAGDEVTIPISAFRTDTGLYSNDSNESKSSGTGSATETTYIGPFQSSQ